MTSAGLTMLLLFLGRVTLHMAGIFPASTVSRNNWSWIAVVGGVLVMTAAVKFAWRYLP